MKRVEGTLGSMATVERSLFMRSCRAPLLAVLFAATSAMAAGDRPPEGKAGPPALPSSQQESPPGPPAETPSPGVRPSDASADTPKTQASRPHRYGTGYEARRGLGGGAGRGGRR